MFVAPIVLERALVVYLKGSEGKKNIVSPAVGFGIEGEIK
jgi:hypothetical protein